MPRSKEDFRVISDERRQSIIDASLRLFSVYGYDSISIDDITKASKCSHGLFYHYFNSKADLLHNLMKYILARWDKKIATLDFEQKAIFVLKDVTNFFVETLKGEDEDAYILYLFLTFHLQKKVPAPPKTDKKRKPGPLRRLANLIKQGQADGDFEQGDYLEYLRAYLACLQGLAFNRIQLGNKNFKNVDAKIICNLIIKKEVNHA